MKYLHLSAEFTSRFLFDRPALASIALGTNNSGLTAMGNDYGYENAYQKFLEYYVEEDTLVVLMSSGGESENILNCLTWCEENSVDYGILTGFSPDNRIRSMATNAIWNYYINSEDYGVVECIHQIFLHGVV